MVALGAISLLACAPACSGPNDISGPARPADAAPAPPSDATAPAVPVLAPLDTEGGDETERLRRIGAVPAWQAVVERGRYLGRRGRQGVVFGRVGGPVNSADARLRWLVDETEGEGALAIRLGFDPRITVMEGQRLVAWGAWWLDPERRWYWKAERVALLEPGDGAMATAPPGLVIPVLEDPPEGAVPVSQLATGGAILFEIRSVPRAPSDGWEITDPGSARPVARLLLPGEQPSYGAQDYRSPDEHWQLAPGTVYTVPVRQPRRSRSEELPVLQARGIPRRVAAP